MRQWSYLQFTLHPRHLDSISTILAELGTRGIHEQALKSEEILLRAYFDPSSDIGRVRRGFQARCRAAAVPLGALLSRSVDVQGKRVAIILSGGNVDLARLPFS